MLSHAGLADAPTPFWPGLRLRDEHLHLVTTEWDVAKNAMHTLYGPYRELGATVQRAAPTRIHKAPFGPFTLSMLRYGRDLTVIPGDFGPTLMVMTVVGGVLSMNAGGEIYRGGQGATLLSAMPDSPSYNYGADTEVVKIHLDQRRLEQQCWQLLGHKGRAPLRFHPAMEEPRMRQRWLALLGYIVSTLDTRTSPRGQEQLAATLEELLMTTLLTGQAHNYSAQLAGLAPQIAPKQWHRAVSFMEAHLCDAVTLAEIAAAAGCSVRSLTRAFRDFSDTTPMRHLLELRLQHVRAELATPCATPRAITTIALHWGFRHLGEFNRRYRERFGETPSQTRLSGH